MAFGVILLAYAVQREIRVRDRELATVPALPEPRFRPGSPIPEQEAGVRATPEKSRAAQLKRDIERLQAQVQEGERSLAGLSGELQGSSEGALELKVADLEERIARAQAELGRAERLREERTARRFDEYALESREFSRALTQREEERRRLLERVEEQKARVSSLEAALLRERARGFDSDAVPEFEARLREERVRLELLQGRLRDFSEELRSAAELHEQSQLWKQREEQAETRSTLEAERARKLSELERLSRERVAALENLEYARWGREELRAERQAAEEELRESRAALEARREELARIFQVQGASEVQTSQQPS